MTFDPSITGMGYYPDDYDKEPIVDDISCTACGCRLEHNEVHRDELNDIYCIECLTQFKNEEE
jgi:hypothetical protein